MTKNSPKADMNFEKDLWKTADELRGAVEFQVYSYYEDIRILIKINSIEASIDVI